MDRPVRDILARNALTLGPEPGQGRVARNWRLARDAEGIAWLLLDCADSGTNTVSREVLQELDRLLGTLAADRPRGLVLRSAKPGGFAAGADIRDFRGADDPAEVADALVRAHEVVDRLAALPVPSVALIHGHCLGAGLELALACRFRVAIEGASLGFPEVLLGLHPGLGGTFRATEAIDPTEAMRMMLTGRSLKAARAKSLGLVDAVVPERHAAAAAEAAVAGQVPSRAGGWRARFFGAAPARGIAARRMREETAKRAPKEHYPAPHRLIDIWESHGGDARAMPAAEIVSFSELIVGDTAQNLIRVFFLRERLKGLGRDAADAVSHVHVVGAGAMGGDIAAWCALRGVSVTLTDLEPARLAAACARAATLFSDRAGGGREAGEAADRLVPDFAGDGVAHADIVIEAIAEDEAAKRGLYAKLEKRMKPEALLATNTSSLPLESLREGLERPQNFLGLHFFNPVERMQLVEVVSHDRADPAMLAAARGFCTRIDRLPASVRSAPGFLVNRVLTPYLMEAMLMIGDGLTPEEVDRAAEEFGMAMGPAEVADRVGLDICAAVLDSLRDRLDSPPPAAPDWLRARIEAGETGRKAGKGIYVWKDGKPQKTPLPAEDGIQSDAEVTDRLVLAMVNTTAACLREGVVENPDIADAAMIFAAGFAPFRGGPAAYARARGAIGIATRLEELAERHGDRFRPDPGLAALAGKA
jgi:3-hydroxyacyl-CoA dehydrogenase / enoyl-CoA hydratase / 3-hydroxybutyryl-CoA epimerase